VACSATAYGEYCGTRTALMLPRCFKSTLLNPAHLRANNLTPHSFKISNVSLSALSFTKIQTTSYPFARGAVSAFNLDLK